MALLDAVGFFFSFDSVMASARYRLVNTARNNTSKLLESRSTKPQHRPWALWRSGALALWAWVQANPLTDQIRPIFKNLDPG